MGELGRGKTLHVSSPSHISGNTFWYILGKDHCNTKYFWRVDRNGKRDIIKKRVPIIKSVILKEVINIKAQKSTRGRKYLQSGRYNIFLNYHVFFFILFYFILYYIILSFFCLFSYLFILPQIDPGKKNLPSPSPTRVSPFAASFASCDLPGESRVFSIVSIMAALKHLREVTACICKGDEQPEKEVPIPYRSRR